ncbi:electron transfer flavoprotein beta subunit [Parelusimicrobium proximum]|uniref:electron transfer flavoprotein subunit beta/FixA family protein n=1 Tax=Parelusimicrobium proximum TaxID=3228953 RepID=UPI003D165E46
MHIVVCVKQTPKSENVKIDSASGCLIRSSVKSVLNPFDEFALEEAVKFKELVGGKVSVLTMGPPQAESALRDCISRGADNAYHLCDNRFACSDTWATSYALSQAIKKIDKEMEKVDMIVCGKQTTDSDTGHIGAQISAWLTWPCVNFVKKASLIENKILIERLMEDGTDILEVPFPCVVSVLREINDPRVPSVHGRIIAKKIDITVWDADDIDADKSKLGSASPTAVVKTFAPVKEVQSTVITGTNAKEKAAALINILKEI